jgi:predicted RNA binding protein YcfA (HicA-like mRNA interferase family)
VAEKFPSMKATKLLAVLQAEPLAYEVSERRGGSHVWLVSRNGYPRLRWAFHSGQNLAPGLVREILVKQVGLTEEKARSLL